MGAVAPVAPERAGLRLPLGIGSFAITIIGLAAAVYLTVEHYAASTVLACPEGSVINCAKVTSSSYSMIGPAPVALLGAIYFVAMALLCSPQAWRMRRLDALRIAGAVAGVASALWFVWVELFRLDAICLWCTVVHLATLALLGAVLWSTTGVRAR
ncbi:MAG TPA: vitamin K epoxide reductase family protein [Jatrophihabitans sp.]|jgi:uncharacterized membrane protein|nr:vitamin K epoxide reductase family protein [Jatrophihabitans sp.]